MIYESISLLVDYKIGRESWIILDAWNLVFLQNTTWNMLVQHTHFNLLMGVVEHWAVHSKMEAMQRCKKYLENFSLVTPALNYGHYFHFHICGNAVAGEKWTRLSSSALASYGCQRQIVTQISSHVKKGEVVSIIDYFRTKVTNFQRLRWKMRVKTFTFAWVMHRFLFLTCTHDIKINVAWSL